MPAARADRADGAAATVGDSLPRVDAPAKTTGAAAFVADIGLPGMVWARLLRSPHAHARVTAVRTEAAEALPGVIAVMTRDNAPALRFSSSPSDATPGGRVTAEDEALFPSTVRFAGDVVAMVAAVDVETAEDALELIDVDYEPLTPLATPDAAVAAGAPSLHPDRADNVLGRARIEHGGDVTAALAAADVVIERTYHTARQKHAQLEPQVCVADWDGRRLTVWTPNQAPHMLRTKLARLWSLPDDRVRVVVPNLGGGFGGRIGFVLEHYATAMARHLGRPVKLILTRVEDFTNSESRHAMTITVRAGARRDGALAGLHVRSVLDAGAYAGVSADTAYIHAQVGTRLYRCPRRFEGVVVYTTTPAAGSFRGVGGPQAAFSVEQCIDELAEAVDCDPIEFRRRNALRDGDVDPWTRLPIGAWPIDDVLDRGRAAIDWDAVRGRRRRDGPWRRGAGMAVMMHVSGANCISARRIEESKAVVRVNADGSITALTGQPETGAGATMLVAQLVAAEMALPLDRVSVVLGDTDATPYDSGSHASRTAFTTGWASVYAARDARRRILAAAGEMLEAGDIDLELADGVVRVIGAPARGVTLAEVAAHAARTGVDLTGAGEAPITNAPPFGAHFADVSVNAETGRIRINRYVAVHDVGRALNRSIVEGQIHGAVVQGMGFALSEEVRIDPATGSVQNATFMDYKVLTAADVPPIEVILIERPDSNGPHGAKGAGEVGIVPVAGALANAVADATGVRLLQAPMTPERVLRALDESVRKE
jgi:xanthine dehydrogenase molybdenum-binding subunit